ncbi:hypothetical protein [Fructobacillus ficulneus]|uniref:Uncharacterized protein n=1 Tax=Fructobacillus ficulneus TaxID=157463 RepID=A0A0K8MHM6_9LACO|nr:hypothetical protein [Fructobacillus ficulneus]GAP00057.1 hypothetical protein FFIC_280620 [Fructobacillus ficulneus]
MTIDHHADQPIQDLAQRAHDQIMGPNLDNENLTTYLDLAGIRAGLADFAGLEVSSCLRYYQEYQQSEILVAADLPVPDQVYRFAQGLGILLLDWQVNLSRTPILNPALITADLPQSQDYLLLDYQVRANTKSDRASKTDLAIFTEHFLVPDQTAQPLLDRLDWENQSIGQLTQKFSLIYLVSETIAYHRLTDLLPVQEDFHAD